MDGSTFVVMAGIAAAINLIFIKFKVEKKRYGDAALDTGAFVVLAYLFSGTMSGMAIAMIASAIISVYLWFVPPKFGTDKFNKHWK